MTQVSEFKRHNTTLDDTTVATLKAYGGGNLSEGIRRAANLVSVSEELAGALYDCKQLAVDVIKSEGQDWEHEDEIKRACYALDLYEGKA